MDILNINSWLKTGRYATVPAANSLLVLATPDPSRDDKYLALALNADILAPLHNKGTVTQLTSITTGVISNTSSGVITTVSSTLATLGKATFTVTNSKVTTASVVLVTAVYTGNGNAIATVGAVSNGSFTVNIGNASATTLNAVVKINFVVL